jgi:hypothetical protein
MLFIFKLESRKLVKGLLLNNLAAD